MKTFEQIYAESVANATLAIGYGEKTGVLRATSAKTEQQGQVVAWYSLNYDGDTAVLSLGDRQMGLPGAIAIGGSSTQSILLDAATNTIALGGLNAGHGTLRVRNWFGAEVGVLSAETATLTLGANNAAHEATNGTVVLKKSDGLETVRMDGGTGNLTLGGGGQDGDLTIKSSSGTTAITLGGSTAALTLGGAGLNGDVYVKGTSGADTIRLDGENGNLILGGGTTDGDITLKTATGVTAITLSGSSAAITAGGDGVSGDIIMKNSSDVETIRIVGSTGDIELLNADVAEEFEVSAGQWEQTTPGTVMVLDAAGGLTPCEEAYDTRVVGVVSGAGGYRPAIVLDRNDGGHRSPIALVGKTHCRADASSGAIRVGDLLTTSPRKGHAMRVADRGRAIGAIIGKALQNLEDGTGLIAMVVTPQ